MCASLRNYYNRDMTNVMGSDRHGYYADAHDIVHAADVWYTRSLSADIKRTSLGLTRIDGRSEHSRLKNVECSNLTGCLDREPTHVHSGH